MITFRARHAESPDWTQVSLDGEDEEVLAFELSRVLDAAGWETLVARGAGDFEELG